MCGDPATKYRDASSRFRHPWRTRLEQPHRYQAIEHFSQRLVPANAPHRESITGVHSSNRSNSDTGQCELEHSRRQPAGRQAQ